MFLFLPMLFLGFCSLEAHRHLQSWRVAMLLAAAFTGTALTGITEILSLRQFLSFYPVMTGWLLLTIVAGMVVVRRGHNTPVVPSGERKNWFLSEKICLGMIIFICAASAVTAMVGMPNTWDSMTYHLPRVEHWIQNKTVAYYPTNITRQLSYTPWAEYAIAHVYILGGGETSANFVQWSAMAGSLVGVSLIARQLGANRIGQLVSALAGVTLPMGILQSVSTQTDYVCAFWLIAFVFFLIETQRTFVFVYTIATGLSLGLAFLTKGNGYIFALPFLVWFIGANLKQRIRPCVAAVLLIVILALAINAGAYARNAQTFKSLVSASAPLTNASFSPRILWVNILRNIGVHLTMPTMQANEHTTQFMTKAAQFLGADINDSRATYGENFAVRTIYFDEDYTGNFIHGVLFGIVFLLSWIYRPLRGKTGFYVVSVVAAFLLFCLTVRFQSWQSRFHLPLFILFCPVAGVVVERFLNQKSVVLGMILFLAAMPWLIYNKQHPWTGRLNIWQQPKPAQYFYKRSYLALPYALSAKYLNSIGCRQIGLLINEDTWEYPWWKLLKGPGLRIEHVGVSNPSGALKYPLGDFQPCAIIDTGTELKPFLMVDSGAYGPAWAIPMGKDRIIIYLKKS